MITEAYRPGSMFSIKWVLANTAGAAAGLAVFWWATRAAETPAAQPPGLRLLLALVTESGLLLVVPAAVVGSMQWLVLRRCLAQVGWWIVASTAALAAGMWALLITFSLCVDSFGEEAWVSIAVGALAGGLTAGGVQWLVLRRQVPHAGAWVVVSGLAGPPCVAVFLAATRGLNVSVADIAQAGVLIGVLYGVVTGPVLACLLRAPATATPPGASIDSRAARRYASRPLTSSKS